MCERKHCGPRGQRARIYMDLEKRKAREYWVPDDGREREQTKRGRDAKCLANGQRGSEKKGAGEIVHAREKE